MTWGEHKAKLPPGETINSWPSCLNNACWSKDNIIAVGGEDVVVLLVPKYKRQKTEDASWDQITLRTSQFTDDEYPLQLPLTWKSFSIGEEQSEACVTALDWSPPGLAKHKRCVLAVLTSNHALSLWECTGRLEDSADWKRVLVINHALWAYNEVNDRSIIGEISQEKSERHKLKQRIRTFSWSQSLPSNATTPPGACDTIDQPLLAVSTESGDVYFVKLKSPHDMLSPEITEWSALVTQTFHLDASSAKTSLTACLPPTSVGARPFIDQLAWSPWSRDAKGTLSSVIAFTTQEALQCKIIRAHVGPEDTFLELGTTVTHLVDDRVAHSAGAMRWVPKPTSAEELYLVYPCRGILYCLVFHLKKASGVRPTRCQLANAWDELSGIAFATHRGGQPYIQLTYHQNSIDAPSSGLSLPLAGEAPLPVALWQHQLSKAQAQFSSDFELQSNTMTRTYGICSSPLGDSFAVSSTFHPSDGVEYIVHSDHVSTLGITPVREDIDNDMLPFDSGPTLPYELSAEAVLSSLQRFFERKSEQEPAADLLMDHILQAFDLNGAFTVEQSHASIPEDTPTNEIARQLKQNILFQGDCIAARVKQLATMVTLKKTRKAPPLDAGVIRRITTEVVRLPHFIAEASPLSQTISNIHSLILTKLDARDGRNEGEHLALTDYGSPEKCDICGSGITFESLRWARCTNDHQFTRCGLTFLAIQAPGTAKSCGICNMQYLNEYAIPGLKHVPSKQDVEMSDLPPEQNGDQPAAGKQGGTDQEPVDSLVRILFAACDRCVCCGGKFAG